MPLSALAIHAAKPKDKPYSIGIIGAGQIGSAIASALSHKGIAATIANSRGPESLQDLLSKVGPAITGGTVAEAASKDIVVIAVNWSRLPALFATLPDFAGRIVVDTNNPIEAPLFKPVDLGGVASSEVVAGLAQVQDVEPALRVPFALDQVTGGRRMLVDQALEDLLAMMEPGLTALLDAHQHGGPTAPAAMALWQEFLRARRGLMALAPIGIA